MMASNRASFSVSLPLYATADAKSRRSCLCILPTASLFLVIFFIGSMFVATDFKERWLGSTHSPHPKDIHYAEKIPLKFVESLVYKLNKSGPVMQRLTRWSMVENVLIAEPFTCENQCRPQGSEALPKGIVVKTSNLKLQPRWGSPKERNQNSLQSMNLLAIAVGIRQKENVDKMVQKFPSSDFIVMLFHYDGIVDKWSDLEWSSRAIHVSAIDQTKWWFAKRFLHPDIVSEYDYIFLWDEDLGVENFNPGRYISIVKEEGLEISQPALDIAKSEVHHQITARTTRSKVHRRTYKRGGCDANSTAPPCTGYVEMMAPVFSRASWRCTWYMIQNDLIYGWGLDFQLGYCAQGDRTKNIGVVDAEYIIHQGLPTLGGSEEITTTAEAPGPASPTEFPPNIETQAASHSHVNMDRYAVRKQSFIEFNIFKNRWTKAVQEDQCWVDPFQQLAKQ